MWWLILAAIITGLLLLPVGIQATYDSEGAAAWLKIGPVPLQLYPHPPKKSIKGKGAATTGFEKKKSVRSGGKATDFFPLAEDLLALLSDLRKNLRVTLLRLKLTLAGGDPCDLALNYAKAWAAVGNLMPRLEQFLRIRKRDVDVQCDFVAEETLVVAECRITITIGRLLAVLISRGFPLFKKIITIQNQRKGGINDHE